jgi:hypothetical protein
MAGTTDTVPAMLTPGEFVIKQESAAMLGEPLLQKLNAVSDNAPQGYQAGGGVSQNSGAHGNIDALIGQAQLENMMGNVVPGYQDGDVVAPAEQALPDWGRIRTNPLLRLFSEKNQHIFPTELESSIYDRDEAVSDSLDETGLDWMSDEFDIEHSKAMNGMTASNYDDVRLFLQDMDLKKRHGTMTADEKEDVSSSISDLIPAIKRLFSENPDIFKSAPEGTTRAKGDYEAQEISPELPLTRRYNKTLGSAFNRVLPDFYENGGGVGEAGRKYPPGTIMSPFMGDKAPIPEAWMQPATDSIPSPEEVAEFDRMIKTLQAQELLKKQLQKMQELGMFSDKEAVEYRDEGIQFPVRQEGYPQR